MKKILWLSHILPFPLESGVILRSYNLIKQLSKTHDVTLLAFNQRDNCPTRQHIDAAIDELESFCTVADVVEIPSENSMLSKALLVAGGILPTRTYTTHWLNSTTYKEALESLLSRQDFDVIHYDTISLAPYYIADSRFKSVLNHHNIESEMMTRRSKSEKNVLKRLYIYLEGRKLRNYENSVLSNFDLHITCSELDSRRLRKVGAVSFCETIPNGVDTNYFYHRSAPTIPYSIIFTGSLSWYPNVDAIEFFLNKVWPDIVEKEPRAKISIIGKNPPAWLKSMSKQDPRIHVHGYVNDVRPHIESACVYACPIKDGGGTKLKILNALSMGKCIVADPVACEGIDVEDGKHLLQASSPEEYTETILKAFSDDRLRALLEANARTIAIEKYDFVSVGKKMSDLYENL